MYKWIEINASSDFEEIGKYVSKEYSPLHVAQRLASGISSAVKAILVEPSYVDKDYRSTYYHFYAKMGQRYRPDCVRLHLFDETVTFDSKALVLQCADSRLSDHYFGFMVLRPTGVATIGRSVVSPDIRSGAGGMLIQAKHKIHLLGEKLEVFGFPSMDQHIDISVCAHAACWSILRHYSERYSSTREFLTHDITRMAHEFNPGGLVPSKGLQVSHAERVFQEAGTFPVVVSKDVTPGTAPDLMFYRQLIAYVESGFPLFAAMHSRAHAIAIIGYERTPPQNFLPNAQRHGWDEVGALIAIDDNHLPYLSVPAKPTGSSYSAEDIDAFIVPLPEKVFYPADAVDGIVPILWKFSGLLGLPAAEDTVVRYFITTSSALRHFMRGRSSEFDPRLLVSVMMLPMAQFVWVIEIASKADWASGNISARAVLDATASLREALPLWLFHSRKAAVLFDRSVVGADISGALKFTGLEQNAFSRMEQNLRPIQKK